MSTLHFRNKLSSLAQRQKLARIVVDEAHCLLLFCVVQAVTFSGISTWGHDFRPSFRKIQILRALDVPMFVSNACFRLTHSRMAVTATATESVRKDIIQSLALKNPALFLLSFNRPNIHYAVRSISRCGFSH